MIKTNTLNNLICTIPLLLLFAGVGFGQSFYKTFSTINRPIKAKQTSTGYEIDLEGFKKYQVIRTDANGNQLSSSTYDYTNADGFDVGLRLSNGEYLMYKTDDNAGRMRYQIRDQNNNIKRAFSLFYPAGQKGAVGAMEQYADGTVFIAYSFGAGDFGDPQPRTISYVKRNIFNDRNDMTGRFQTLGGVVNSPTNAVLLPDGTIYMTILQDISSSFQSYVAKINATGNVVWRKQVSSLERFVRNFTADTEGDIWYTFSQSFANVIKLENASGVGSSFFPDQFGFSGTDVGAIVPTRTGGIVMAAGVSSGQLRTIKLDNNQNRLANNTITAAQTNANNKSPLGGIRNSNDEIVLFGFQSGGSFLMKLGKDGQWVSGGTGGGIDLSLTSSSSTPNPGVWQQMSMVITVRNTGTSTATNVQVKVEIPDNDVVLNGGNPFSATKGDFQWWGNSVWTVGSVSAGATERLTLNLWNRNTNAKEVCAQVTAAGGGTDSDSTPNNGANCRDAEDDETSFSFNGGGGVTPQLPDLGISDFQISNNILKQGDVRNFTFDLNNTGDAKVQGNYVINAYMSTSQSNPGNTVVGVINTGNTGLGTTQNVPGALTVPSNLTPGTYYVHLIADANNQIAEKNENNNRRVSPPIVVQINSGSALPDLTVRNVIPQQSTVTIGEGVSVKFDNASIGATIPLSAFPIAVTLYMSTDRNLSSNDYKILDLNVGTGPGIGFGGQVPTNLPAGQYYLIVKTDTPNRLAEANENNNVGVSSSRVTAVAGSGGGTGAIDVNMTAANSNPAQWGFFSVTLTAKNTGSSTASNVKVKFNNPDEVTYKGGDTHSASTGSFQWWGNHEWTIGSLGANQTATITINYFRLSANGFAITGTVTSGGGNDAATVNFGSSANGSVGTRAAIIDNMVEEPFAIVKGFPNPSTDYIQVQVFANEAQTSEVEIFSLSGNQVFSNPFDLQEGINTIRIETTEFATGNYFIKMDPFHPYLRKLHFVVARP